MSVKIVRLSAFFLLSLGLSGCFGGKPEAPQEELPLSPVGQFMTMNDSGATSVIDDPEFGGEVRVTLEEAFVSAAGETCRRATVLSARQEAEVVVICRNAAGNWVFAPRVWGRGL